MINELYERWLVKQQEQGEEKMNIIKKISIEIDCICETILSYSGEPYIRNITNQLISALKESNIEDILFLLEIIKTWYKKNQNFIQTNDFVYDKDLHIKLEKKISKYIEELEENRSGFSKSDNGRKSIVTKKIFVSHSSSDEIVGNAFVNLLEGIGLSEDMILYSSSARHGVPGDTDIFEYLRGHISEGITVFYMLSDNYYKSIYCLNEMGAAWVTQNDFSIFLLPNFSGGIKGVIDSNRKAYNLSNPIELTQFKNNIKGRFNLDISDEKWEDIKNKFMKELSASI